MKDTIVLLIIFLVLILVVIGIICNALYQVNKKAGEFARQIFGTDTLREGFENMETEYATTPKSVSAMTSLVLPRITKDFPDFSYDEMKKKAQNVLTSYLLSIHNFNYGHLSGGNTDLKTKVKNAIQILKNKEQREYFDDIKIHRTELSAYTKKAGRCIVTFQSSIQYYHYIEDKDGNLISGSKDNLYQSKYEVDLIYIQDRSLVENELESSIGVNCPNCGAPITNLGEKFCEYCGSAIVELNIHAWSFFDVREVV